MDGERGGKGSVKAKKSLRESFKSKERRKRISRRRNGVIE